MWCGEKGKFIELCTTILQYFHQDARASTHINYDNFRALVNKFVIKDLSLRFFMPDFWNGE